MDHSGLAARFLAGRFLLWLAVPAVSTMLWGCKPPPNPPGPTQNQTVQIPVPPLFDIVYDGVFAGDIHTCALSSAGKLACWGNNTYGQLGEPPSGNCLGGGPCSTKPVLVPVLQPADLRQVALGNSHTCALLKKGTVSCWGNNTSGQVGDGTTMEKHQPTAVVGLFAATNIALGGAHSCARLVDGVTVSCWGNNSFGQLGDGTTTQRTKPVAVSGLPKALQIVAGSAHTCALLIDQTVRCWGSNVYGQLGDGTKTDRHLPTKVPGLSDVIGISAGGDHTCAQLDEVKGFAVACWGSNAYNELGVASNVKCGANLTSCLTSPQAIPGLSKLATIALAASHTCIRHQGSTTISCWGANASGQLGLGDTNGRSSPTPLSLQSIERLTAGGVHTCARVASKDVYCWGENSAGQLGDGTLINRSKPVKVNTLPI